MPPADNTLHEVSRSGYYREKYSQDSYSLDLYETYACDVQGQNSVSPRREDKMRFLYD